MKSVRHARVSSLGLIVFATCFGLSCKPSLDDDPSRVDRPRVLAVRSEPAEAKPGDPVTLFALYSDSVVTGATLSWGFCAERRALAEPTALSQGCLDDEEGARIQAGRGLQIPTTVPRDACRAFGPDPPVGKPGEPAGRPADPDATGGYYQPGVVASPSGEEASFEVRVRCGLSGATQTVVTEFERTYRPNVNPSFADVSVLDGARVGPVGDGEDLTVAPLGRVHFRVSWPTCSAADACGGAESFPTFDPEARALVTRREAMRVSWLASSGTFDAPRTGRDETDDGSDSESTWLAPSTTGDVTLWFVLRDSRGGAAFRSLRVHVAG